MRDRERVVRFLKEYKVALVAAVILAVAVASLPAGDVEEFGRAVGEDRRNGGAPSISGNETTGRSESTDRRPSTGVDQGAGSGPSGRTGGASAGDADGATDGATSQGSVSQVGGSDFGSDCDTNTGRIRVPSVYAPPCVPSFSGDNGGVTYPGVTEDTIKIAVYIPAQNPAVEAIFEAGGGQSEASDPEATGQTHRDYVDYFESHYESHGREVEVVVVEASGNDQQSAKADAIKVAEEIQAFASIRGPYAQAVYAKELAARGVLCIECINALPNEHYLDHAPFIWGRAMSWHQGAMEQSEYICKRLWGRQAKWAGDPVYQQKERVLGMIYFDTADGDYESGPDFFQEELERRCGGRLDVTIGYALDLARAQEQSRVWVAKLKDEGVTTVYLPTDPFYPIFITKEATRQNYFPEWGVTSFWNEANFFARMFDQAQWSNAFGAASRGVLTTDELSEARRIHRWHHGRPPETRCCYWSQLIFFTGVHMAGPNLTPETFRDGLFAYPPSGGGPTTPNISFGPEGGLWPFDDYLAIDDKAEVWWDAQAQGPDEAGNQGLGMYRYMEGGRRVLPGDWPTGEPQVFRADGTVTHFDDRLPPEDRPPAYEHEPHQ